MNRFTAWRLARRVTARSKGPGWWRLLEAAGRGDRAAEAAIAGLLPRWRSPDEYTRCHVWQVVLARPDPHPRLWHAVRGIPWDPEFTVDIAAREDGHPATALVRAHVLEARDPATLEALSGLALDRPGLAAWCAAHDVVPADPVTAAALFLLTGQRRRYHAADPDARLLAAAFAAAGPDRRQRLLAAVATAGDVDLAALAGHRREFWAMVWRLPVAEAVAAVRAPRSAPGEPALRQALTRDRGPDRRPLPPPWYRRLDAEVLDLALAPDATRLAVLTGGSSAPGTLLDLDLNPDPGSGRPGDGEHRYRFELSPETHDMRAGCRPVSLRVLAHLGDAVLGLDEPGLCRFAGGRRRVLVRGDGFANVIRTRAGFAATRADGRVYLGTADGVERVSDAAAAVFAEHRDDRFARGHWLAASPDGAYLAVATPTALAVLDAAGETVATLRPRPHAPREYVRLGDDRSLGLHGVAFVAPGVFVVMDRTRTQDAVTVTLTRYRIEGATLVAEDSRTLPAGRSLDGVDGTPLLLLGEWGVAAVDGRTLEPVALPDPDRHRYPRGAAGWLATARSSGMYRTELRLHRPPVYTLLDRPMQDVSPAELGELEAALDAGAPSCRPLLETLRDCVRLRYEREVELGAFTPAGTDIALGPA